MLGARANRGCPGSGTDASRRRVWPLWHIAVCRRMVVWDMGMAYHATDHPPHRSSISACADARPRFRIIEQFYLYNRFQTFPFFRGDRASCRMWIKKSRQKKVNLKTSATRKIVSERGEETRDPPLPGGPRGHNLLSMDVSPVLLVITYVLLLSFSKRCSARTHTRSRHTQKNANK